MDRSTLPQRARVLDAVGGSWLGNTLGRGGVDRPGRGGYRRHGATLPALRLRRRSALRLQRH